MPLKNANWKTRCHWKTRPEKHDAVEKRDLKNGTKKSKFRCVDTVTARNCVKTSPKPERFEIIPKRCEMKTETLGGVVWTQNPVLFRPALVPNLPYLKTVTLAAFRLIFFALLWGPSELSLTCQQILTVSCEHTRTLPTYSSCRHRVKIALTTIFRSCFIHISSLVFLITFALFFFFSGLLTGSPPAPPKPYFQPIKQSTSAPASPLSFSARLCSGSSPFAHLTSAPSPKHSLVYPPPQTINIQDFTAHFNRGLISHTLGWPSEAVEKQVYDTIYI